MSNPFKSITATINKRTDSIKKSFGSGAPLQKNNYAASKAINKVIASEKGVTKSIASWTNDTHDAAVNLATWGANEGDDLSDVTRKTAELMFKLAIAEGEYANTHEGYRTLLKQIRNRENRLARMIIKKEKIEGVIEKETRKVQTAKDPVHHQHRLDDAKIELAVVAKQVIQEETALADFKRVQMNKALTMKMEHLEILGKKIAGLAKYIGQMATHIPTDETPVGEPRAPYTGTEKTQEALVNGYAAIGEEYIAPSFAPGEPGREISPLKPTIPTLGSQDADSDNEGEEEEEVEDKYEDAHQAQTSSDVHPVASTSAAVPSGAESSVSSTPSTTLVNAPQGSAPAGDQHYAALSVINEKAANIALNEKALPYNPEQVDAAPAYDAHGHAAPIEKPRDSAYMSGVPESAKGGLGIPAEAKGAFPSDATPSQAPIS